MDTSRHAVRELSEVGRAGCLELVFGLKAGKTIIRDVYSEIPHKITRLYYPENSSLPQLILMNATAGLFPGDRVETRVVVEKGARVLITSQASTKVHPGTGVAEQTLQVSVADGAELYFHNDPLIPFRGARLRQRVQLRVAAGARLYFWESFMAGRVGRGEAWAFEEIDSELRLCRDEKIAYLERYRLHPGLTVPNCPQETWTMRDAMYVATGVLCDPEANMASTLAAPNIAFDEPVRGVWLIRAIAKTGSEYRQTEQQVLSQVFAMRGEVLPDMRKY
jgi:urease accessory protein UreH